MTSTTDHTPERVSFASDVITTAIEGGVNYWAATRDYVHDMMDGYTPEQTRAIVVDLEDGDEHEVTVPRVLAVLDRLVAGEGFNLPVVTVERYRAAIEEDDAGQIDAGDADAIVQLVAFDQIVYG